MASKPFYEIRDGKVHINVMTRTIVRDAETGEKLEDYIINHITGKRYPTPKKKRR